jgi:hypothetical protein
MKACVAAPRCRHAVVGPFFAVLAAAGCAWYPQARPPAGLRIDCATAAVVGLRWDDARATPARYRISRDGRPLGTTVGTTFADTTVAPSQSYRYTVAAQSGFGTGAESEPLSITTEPASANGDAPACPSPLIAAASWDWAHGYRAAEGSDLWPATWGADGSIYAFFGDGGGFGGDDHRGRTSFGVARIDGQAPPVPSAEINVYGGYLAQHPSMLSGKASAIIAVGRDYYAIGGIYRDTDPKGRNPAPISGSPEHVEIIPSLGDAYSWRDGAWDFCGAGDFFCPSGFVQFGPGYSGAPDRYVYIFGTRNPALDPGAVQGGTYLARVDRRRLLSKPAYRYFAGLNTRSRPIWSADSGRMQPILVDRNSSQPGCGGRCLMSSVLEEAIYDAPLERYIGVAQGDYLAQTSFYDAPQPWGPWTSIAYHNIEAATGGGGWGNLGAAAGGSLGVHPVNAWTSADGRTLWLTFSSDGKAPPGALFPPPGSGLDAFQLVRMDLEVGR